MPVIKVTDLCKSVPQTDHRGVLNILQHISFTVEAAESVAVTGASGSGKSTLLGLLAGLDVPSSGSIQIRGTDLFALNEDERAALRGQMIGFVFQTFQLLPSLTALENIMLPLELADKPNARRGAQEWLERVGLAQRATHYPKHLSGGEQQRVALARAFATRPALLLADEPTGNLDTATGKSIENLMFELNREAGTTLVLVTHDETLAHRCSCRLHMQAGTLQEKHPPR